MRVPGACLVLFALAALFSWAPARDADAADGAAPTSTKCTCREGNACYHWLNAPVTAPADPCSCPSCRFKRGSCLKSYPAGWNTTCAGSGRIECFLRRHAASWKIVCSEEMGKCDCPGSDSASCPECGEGDAPSDPKRFEGLRKQISIEKKLASRDGPLVVARSPNFYVVSDLPSIRVSTQNGPKREFLAHELVHLYLQRAELAYKDFVAAFGPEIRASRPIAIFINKRTRDSERFQTQYFGRASAGFVYGSRVEGVPPISGGYAEAGLALDLEKEKDDDGMHIRLRTSLGSILVSLWHSNNPTEPHLPMWVLIGSGHWLGRLPAAFGDMAAFVAGEGNAPTDQGDDWSKRVAKAASEKGFPQIDTFLGFTTLSQTDLTTHMRAWSWFDLFLAEDRERFLGLLRLVRDAKNQREAIREVFACTPDELEARWRARVTGRRRSLAEGKGDAPGEAAGSPGGGFAGLANESDPGTVADRIKARQSIDDPADAAALVALLDRDSDLVHERAVLALAKAKAAAVRDYLRDEALPSTRGHVKASVVRILGLAKDDDAAELLFALLTDADPEIRVQAAVAMGRLRHEPAIPKLGALVADKADEVAIAAMDGLAAFGERAEDSWLQVAPRLDDTRRAVRTTAAECLGALASMESIDALIEHMAKEDGRVRADIRQALKRITRDDLGADPGRWKAWWEKEKGRNPNATPKRPAEKPPEKPGTSRYADQPAFYGIDLFSKRLAFVLDVSSSMGDHIVVDPSWLSGSGRTYLGDATKYELATSEIAATLRTVDPRLEFGVITFRSEVKSWKPYLVAANSGNVEQAIAYLGSQRPVSRVGEGSASRQKTNLADALRIAFGIRPGSMGRASHEAADEVYVMTDGQPTAGDLVDADVLLSWFAETNRLARMRMHVVTFETIDVDTEFLRSLAYAGGGTFVLVPQSKR